LPAWGKVAFGTLVQLVLEGRESAEIRELMTFSASVGLPVTLAELGIETCHAERARIIAERAVAPGETSIMKRFEVTWVAIKDAILAADALGQAFIAP
jgi:glycerol dehydrogenase